MRHSKTMPHRPWTKGTLFHCPVMINFIFIFSTSFPFPLSCLPLPFALNSWDSLKLNIYLVLSSSTKLIKEYYCPISQMRQKDKGSFKNLIKGRNVDMTTWDSKPGLFDLKPRVIPPGPFLNHSSYSSVWISLFPPVMGPFARTLFNSNIFWEGARITPSVSYSRKEDTILKVPVVDKARENIVSAGPSFYSIPEGCGAGLGVGPERLGA